MVQFFSGYAQQRGFKPVSSTRKRRDDEQYVRSVQEARDADKRNAKNIHDALQEQFSIDQQLQQTYLDLESRAAKVERQAKLDTFEAEIKAAEQRAKDKTDLLKSISSHSTTALKTLADEKKKQNQARLQLNQNLVLQYGLTSEEVQQLQAMEGGLANYENEQNPLIHRLRQAGASEEDIGVLMKKSGWNAYGSALGVVQKAAQDYDFYLTSKYDENVTINGQDMSLASAESQGDVASIAGIFDRHRLNFLNERLPGFDPAFVAKYAREGMQNAESRRKKSMATRIEEASREGNYAKEKDNLALAINTDPSDFEAFNRYVENLAGGADSDLIGPVSRRVHEQLIELTKDGVVHSRTAEGILDSYVTPKHLGGRTVKFRNAFPTRSAELRAAIDEQDDDRNRVRWNALQEDKRRGEQMATAVIQEFADNPETMTTANIQAAVDAITKTGQIDAANKVAKLLPNSLEKTNDKEFDQIWAGQKALGVFPTSEQILFARLTPGKMTAELQARRDFEDTGLSTAFVSNIDKRIKAVMMPKLIGMAYPGVTQGSPPQSYYAASNAAKEQVLKDFRIAYKGNAAEAETYAINELIKEIDKPDGLYKLNPLTDNNPGYANFPGTNPVKKASPLPAIVAAHKNGAEGFRSELFIDTGRAKVIATNLNKGTRKSIPTEFFHIQKASGANMSEIIVSQIEQARKVDPTIPELRPEVIKIFKGAEGVVPPDVLDIIQRYNTPATVDRNLIQSNIPALYDRQDPFVSFGRMIESTGKVRPDLIPTFLAIMAGESGLDPTNDTKKSGLDPNAIREFSIGLLQVNTKAHMAKLRRLGYTVDDLRNPVRNLEVAMMVYEEWIQVRMDRYGDTLEEAQVNALDRWGAFTDGGYLPHLEQATKDWSEYKQQQGLSVWNQSCNMTPKAKAWCADNPGVWN